MTSSRHSNRGGGNVLPSLIHMEERIMSKRLWRTLSQARPGLVVLAGLTVSLWASGPVTAAPVTKITSCPFTISAPGEYLVTADCTVPSAGTGITISASNVHLNLGGHTLTQPSGGLGIGIVVTGASNVHINNGTVQGLLGGIVLSGASGNLLNGLTVSNNLIGIELDGSGNSITGNSITGSSAGILVGSGSGNTIQSNTATSNFFGILVVGGTGNTVQGNNTSSNSVGIVLGQSGSGNLVSGNVSDNNVIPGGLGGLGIDVYSTSNVIRGNEANGNGSTGIIARAGATGNTFQLNTALGNAPVDLFDDNAPVGGTCPNTWTSDTFDPGSTGGAGAACIK
jgi:parallel beta-helix repeat protein